MSITCGRREVEIAPLLETVNCLVCDSDQYVLRYQLSDMAYGLPGVFTYVTCRQCGHLFQSPRPAQDKLAQYYPAQYEPFRQAIEEETANVWIRWLRTH